MKITYRADAACPFCGVKLDEATCVENNQSEPGPGDISICMYCAEILEFDANMQLKQATLSTLLELDQAQHALLDKAVERIRARRTTP